MKTVASMAPWTGRSMVGRTEAMTAEWMVMMKASQMVGEMAVEMAVETAGPLAV